MLVCVRACACVCVCVYVCKQRNRRAADGARPCPAQWMTHLGPELQQLLPADDVGHVD